MDIAQLISTVGFPIVSFLLCGFALKYVYDHEGAKSDKLVDENMKRLEDLTQAVNHNSETIARLVDKLDMEEK